MTTTKPTKTAILREARRVFGEYAHVELGEHYPSECSVYVCGSGTRNSRFVAIRFNSTSRRKSMQLALIALQEMPAVDVTRKDIARAHQKE